MLQARLLVITAHRCFVRFLVHQFAVNLHSQVCQVCFRAFEQELRVKRVSLQDRVTQFHNDGTWLNNGPRTQYPALHSWCRRPELGESIAHPSDEEECDGGISDPSDLFGASI